MNAIFVTMDFAYHWYGYNWNFK